VFGGIYTQTNDFYVGIFPRLLTENNAPVLSGKAKANLSFNKFITLARPLLTHNGVG